ncbi:polyphosphate kinase 2 family protein [Prosthecobacter sp.]|uniref:polyphosphate kinase 2 family protein n=1 Tax=Prosthecobacter sp. TaxID=1965333 RepID=UPI002AB9ACB8|nr:polyphosphate kinase 2 family protein [Prosthecobacter sp.]MDZ4405584.1 polyphosphate kinase 2 family protein [Prosthecobacter sp.]
MKLKLDLEDFRVPDGRPFRIKKARTKVKDVYRDDAHYESLIAEFRMEIDDLQQKMYAQNRQGLLLVFQAMDAAGKDSTIKHVMSGVNTQGVEVHAFKRPTDDELDHDFLWRTTRVLPPRGRIGIFNRSYYEEVLVCRIHPEIVTKIQRLPGATTKSLKKLFADRLKDIGNLESYCHRNGIRIVKFFLHVSKEEQKKRFLARIDTPSKNWKFEEGDVKERSHWKDYMVAYEDAIRTTATDECPWYVVPADDKKNMRLIVSAAILAEMQTMKLKYPELPEEQKKHLQAAKRLLLSE